MPDAGIWWNFHVFRIVQTDPQHTHIHTRNARTRIPTAFCSPSTRHHVSALFCVFQSIFLFCINFLLWFLHTAHRESERERERKRGMESEAAKLVTFLIYQQYANDAQFKAYNWVWFLHFSLSSPLPLSQYLQSVQFHLRFNMLFMGGHCMNLPINRKKGKWKTIVSMSSIFYESFWIIFNIRYLSISI